MSQKQRFALSCVFLLGGLSVHGPNPKTARAADVEVTVLSSRLSSATVTSAQYIVRTALVSPP